MGNVAEMQTVEDPQFSGRVQEPLLEILVETTTAPRRRVLNAQILRAIPSSLVKVCDPLLDKIIRDSKDALCASVMTQIAGISHPPAQRRRELVEPPSWKGNQLVRGPFDEYRYLHVRPVPTHHVHRVLMGYPDAVGAKSHLVESAQDWVDRVSPQQHFDPGWSGKEPMVAPGGNPDWEHAWSQTKKGVTLLIPGYEQLRSFEDGAYGEFAMQYFTTTMCSNGANLQPTSA